MALVLTLLGFVDLGLLYPGANARASFIMSQNTRGGSTMIVPFHCLLLRGLLFLSARAIVQRLIQLRNCSRNLNKVRRMS